LMNILKLFSTNLHPEVRMVCQKVKYLFNSINIDSFLIIIIIIIPYYQTLCRSLILLRNKSLLSPTDLLSLFFELLRCQDKALRQFLQMHIINDIKNINSKHKDAKLNKVKI
jgi:hypothetical protein